MRTSVAIVCVLALAVFGAGCGKTEKSGSVGDELTADDLEVTVLEVDQRPPKPRRDVTGLSLPARGYRLVGVRVKVCSDHGGAIGPYSFSIESSQGKGRLKFPARNYRDDFEAIRDDCGDGWVVFEIPADSKATKVRFGYEDTGTSQRPQDAVDARFEWEV